MVPEGPRTLKTLPIWKKHWFPVAVLKDNQATQILLSVASNHPVPRVQSRRTLFRGPRGTLLGIPESVGSWKLLSCDPGVDRSPSVQETSEALCRHSGRLGPSWELLGFWVWRVCRRACYPPHDVSLWSLPGPPTYLRKLHFGQQNGMYVLVSGALRRSRWGYGA